MKRILVTRAEHQAGKLSDGLRAAGFEPVEVPVLEIKPPASFDPLDAALRKIQSYDWLIFTSFNSIPAFHVRAIDSGIKIDALRARVAAVGKATAQAVETFLHLKVSITPREYVAESLVSSLRDQIAGKRVLLARAAVARDLVPDSLRAVGAIVDVVDAYQNVIPDGAPESLRAALAAAIDAATFTSSSSATHLAEVAQAADVKFPISGVKAISIGPITSATLRELGWPAAAEADPHDIPGLIAAVESVLKADG
ncbi:MAG TPA: uroporphyrinogen-III synthase [Terracidiphilus sp.]|jgi:uroporphyrinogen-III synthase/uroporphyrinogen III methyltransferase/synthase